MARCAVAVGRAFADDRRCRRRRVCVAKLVAVSAGARSSYEWEYSVDGGRTRVTAPVTLQAKTIIAGLTPGATVLFRYRPVTKKGEGDWSQTVPLIVKWGRRRSSYRPPVRVCVAPARAAGTVALAHRAGPRYACLHSTDGSVAP